MRGYRLLLTSSDDDYLTFLKALFEGEGYETITARDGTEALEQLLRTRVDLVVTDILTPNMDGYHLCYRIRLHEKLKAIPIIIHSDALNDHDEQRAIGIGADSFISRPARKERLVDGVAEILRTAEWKTRSALDKEQAFEILHEFSTEQIHKLELRNRDLEESRRLLERTVEEQKKSLDEAREKLLASNEELRTANGELAAMNHQLLLASDKMRQQSDIIIRQQAEALEKLDQDLGVIFLNTQEEILVLNKSGQIVHFNDALRKFMTSATGQEPRVGMFLWEMTLPERKQSSRELFELALLGKQIEEEVCVAVAGKKVVHCLKYSPGIVAGEIKYVTVIASDVTEKKQQEDRLRQSEAHLKAIFDSTPDTFALLNIDLDILVLNESRQQEMAQWSERPMSVGENILDAMSGERQAAFKGLIEEASRGETAQSMYSVVIDGLQKWFEFSLTPVLSSREKISGYCLSWHDVTRIKDAELEITRLNKSLTDFQNAIYRSSIVSMTDKEGNIVFLNDNFVKASGYSREELMGKNHRLINSGYHPRSFWAGMWRTISSGETWRGRVKSKRKDGTYFWVDTFVMPFLDDHGRVTSYMSIRNDITQVKNAEDELMQKRVLLEEASRIANIGYWVQDKKSGEITVSNEMLSLFGITEAEYQDDRTILQAMVHPDDAAKVQMLTEPLDPGTASVQADYRIRRKDGSTRWIHQKVDFGNNTSVEDKILGTVQDITERKLSEDLLREFNERFELLMKATQDAIWDMDLGKDVIVWNHALPEIFGYDEGYLRTKASWWESRLHPEDRANVIAGFSAAIERKENKWTSYFRFECADGSFKHVYNRSYILYEDKKPVRVIGSIQDISDRVKAGQEIEKLSLVASKTNNGVMITDKDGMIEWVNESFSKLTGYSLDEIKGKKPTFLQGRETDKDTIRRISAKLREREIISEEIINYTKSGRKVWLHLDVAPVFDDGGRLTNFISIQTNITELKEFENSIIVIARELSSLIENANVPIFGVDTHGNINEWNSVSAKLMEYGKNDVLGIHWKAIFPQEDGSQAFEHAIAKAMEDHSTTNFELPVKTKSGSRVILLASTSPRRNNNDEISGVLFVGQNITELTDYRNNLERIVNERTLELHAALKKEKELVKMKTQFVSIASHEFRTPLTSIALAAGFIKRYKEKITPQSLDEKILNIEKQVNNMTFLLDDILMIGKVEAGKMPVNELPINIEEFMTNLCNEVAKANGNTHEINLTQSLRYREIMSDEKLLRNIVINLLTNAIKFSPNAGRVDVEMTTKNELLYLRVRDYGIGIPEKDIQNLFEPFYRAGNVTSIQGTGLGLSIIKKAVELLKGNIRVSSEVGVGTEINVELPI